MPQGRSTPRIAIVGAGFGGIGTAIALKQAGFHDLVVLEKAPSVGGVWRDNTYPGCACDVPAMLYSFSFAPNPEWSRMYPPHDEILGYLRRTARQYQVDPHLRLSTEVRRAAWDDAEGVWRIAVCDVSGAEPGPEEEIVADVFLPATGQLSNPALPALPGLDTFEGPAFHTARWDPAADLRGKRVGVIGTGASAIQLVPSIADEAAHVTVFQRTPAWTLPKPDLPYPELVKRFRRRWPVVMKPERLSYWNATVVTGMAITGNRAAITALRTLSKAQLRVQIRDRALRERLTPDYPMGCKRVLFTNHWLPAMRREDVTLVAEGVGEVTPTGVRAADGTEHAFDALVFATGFDTDSFLAPMEIRGAGGTDLAEVWRDGAHAYLGMTVPGFPNLFIVYGPNTNTGNTSVIYFEEAQARYVVQAVRRIASDGAALEVREEVADRYDGEIQGRLADSVWVSCANWYRSATGRVVTNWPGLAGEYRRRVRRLVPADFRAVVPARRVLDVTAAEERAEVG